ncbi:MAG: hypothetical protein ACPG4S_05590 [Schleiferiaceae bacterium]|nr:MAG: Uncharacterised protein [Cryomorphaceae bacterium]
MEEKIINNLIYGFPFSFPFWKGPIDQQMTLNEAFLSGRMKELAGFEQLSEDQMERLIKNAKYLFAIYAAGDNAHPKWSEAKNAVRAFPNSYQEIMGITAPVKSWMPKLV